MLIYCITLLIIHWSVLWFSFAYVSFAMKNYLLFVNKMLKKDNFFDCSINSLA